MNTTNTPSLLPEFSAEQYYNTPEPYEYLYQFKDDKFTLSQMREKMKAQAASVGVKGFIGLWNAYLETVTSKQGVQLDNATAFEGQELELLSGQYVCDEYGVYIIDRYGEELNVCRHPIMPVQRLINVDTGDERIKIAFKKGKSWRSIIVEKAVIASSTAILQLASAGVMVNSENAKILSTYLMEIEQLNYDMIPEQKSVGRLGWVGDNQFSPYVDSLVFDGENNFRGIFNAVKENGTINEWIGIMAAMRQEKSSGRIFLAASFASALIEPCGLLPFFVHAWGGTEVGKTVGLMIATSVWANPKLGEYITTFNSTSVGQEMTASMLNSMPMCIDELQIQSTAGVKDFDKIIYQLTEGVGRTRGAKTGGVQKTSTWKNCFITNGEHPISNANSGGGAVNRIIEFECIDKVYSDLVAMCKVITKNYGFAGKKFVEYLQSDGAMDRVSELQKKFYQELLKSDSTDKQAASASIILTADAIATELFFNDGNQLTVEDMSEIMTKKADVDVNQRALEFIADMVASNINRFRTNDFGDYSGEVWGKYSEDSKYLYIIKTNFDREMQSAGFNPSAFLSWAKRKDYILTNDGKRTRKCRICCNIVNCVCISRAAYEGFIETTAQPK